MAFPNPSKSDAILFGSHQRLRTLPTISTVNIAGTSVKLSDHITTLGVTIDNKLTFNNQVASVCKSSYFHIRAFRHIRPFLTDQMATAVAVAIVQSRLDYANSLLYGISVANLNKLQRVQNAAARLVLWHSDLSSSNSLSRLHWLPVR